ATKNWKEKAQGPIERSRQTATVTVAEMLETHGMLRSDTSTMFERLRDANGLLQEVIGGAKENLGQVEHLLSRGVAEPPWDASSRSSTCCRAVSPSSSRR